MKTSKIIMLIGALLLLLLFVFPLWNITLEAPQYPDAIGMDIWINKITDASPNDIKNINLMNHYVGMERIPEHMKEFEIFPPVILVMTALGIAAAFFGNPRLFLAWFILMCLLGAAGMYDFYLWEYNYGHNLDPHAAIKIPGQGYQPPLIGARQILNFRAISMPRLGGYALFVSIACSLLAFFKGKKENK